jgi:hypothetical protein
MMQYEILRFAHDDMNTVSETKGRPFIWIIHGPRLPQMRGTPTSRGTSRRGGVTKQMR